MQKNHIRHRKLISELALLRKGSGITPIKMQQKSILREIAAKSLGIDSNGITNSQTHNFLLTELSKLPHTPVFQALRYALSLSDETMLDDTLFQRRRKLALTLGKHTDTIIRYENQAIAELALRLEEVAASPSIASANLQPTPVPIYPHKNIIRDMATLSLSGLLPVADRAPELVRYLEQSQRPYLEVNITIKFLPSSRGKNWYRLEVGYTFSGVRDTFRLAIVMDSEDGEALITQGLIDDFHKLNDTIDPRREIRTILNNSHFTAHRRTTSTQKLLRFHELEPPQADTLFQSVNTPLNAHCRFLEVAIPTSWQGTDVLYEYRSAFNLRDDIHYAYWYAPSMMYVKRLTFDYSGFPGRDKWNFIVMPFLGNVADSSIRNEHAVSVHPNSWVMPGNGVALMWGARL